MKKYLTLIFAAFLLFASVGCSNIKEIKINSYRIERVVPCGLNSVDATLSVGVHNPAKEFTVTGGTAVIYRQGRELGVVRINDLKVEGRTDGVYPVSGNLTLSEGVGLLTILSLARNFDENEYSIDLYANIKMKGLSRVKIDKRNIPLSSFSKL